MKKKIIMIGIIITILSTIIFLNINYCPRNFFEDYEDNEHPGIAGMAFTPYKCELCNQVYEHNTTATPKLCDTCATTTNRCEYCGKLKIKN